MALSLEIAGVDRTTWLAAGSCQVSRPLGGRASASALLEDLNRGFTPALNSTFIVKDGATKYFGGTIRSSVERCHADGAYLKKQFTVRALDFNHVCDKRRTPALTYLGGVTLRSIVLDIVSLSLDGEGIDTTNVATGPTILEPISFNYNTVTEAFNKVSTVSANYGDPFLWNINFDKALFFSQFASNPAPFSLTNTSNNFADFEIETTLDNYRNIQHARTEYEIAVTAVESFVGNGVLTGFITSQPITATPPITVNGVPKTIGEFGVDHTGKDFYWVRDGYGIFNQDHATLTGAQTLAVTYNPPATNLVTATNPAGIATYGKFEAVDEQKNINDYGTLVAIAEGGLTQYGTVPVRPRFRTFTAGLEPGQRLTINLTRHGINAAYLIEDISFSWIPARTDFLEYSVRCTSLERAAPARTQWMEKLVEMARVGRPPQQILAASPAAGSVSSGYYQVAGANTVSIDLANGLSQEVTLDRASTIISFPTVGVAAPAAGLEFSVKVLNVGANRVVVWNANYIGPERYLNSGVNGEYSMYRFVIRPDGKAELVENPLIGVPNA